MGVQAITKGFSSLVGKERTEVSEDSHKVQISFIKADGKKQEDRGTIYGLKESLLTRNAFNNLFLKF